MYYLYFLNHEYKDKLLISNDLAINIFNLKSSIYPLLSSLSFDDYDIFSGGELHSILDELCTAEKNGELISAELKKIKDIIKKAIDNKATIIFDPFLN